MHNLNWWENKRRSRNSSLNFTPDQAKHLLGAAMRKDDDNGCSIYINLFSTPSSKSQTKICILQGLSENKIHYTQFPRRPQMFPQTLQELMLMLFTAGWLVAAKLWASIWGSYFSQNITSKLILSKDGEQKKCCLCHLLILLHHTISSLKTIRVHNLSQITEKENHLEFFSPWRKWLKA